MTYKRTTFKEKESFLVAHNSTIFHKIFDADMQNRAK